MLHVKVVKANGLVAADSNGCSDPYCILQVGNGETQKTKKVRRTLCPEWNESFDFKVPPASHYLRLEIWDADLASRDDSLGRVMVPLASLTHNPRTAWYTVQRSSSATHVTGEICLQLSVDEPLFGEEIHDDLRFITQLPSVGQLEVMYDDKVLELPGRSEEMEMVVPHIVFALGNQHAVGTLFFTNYRLILVSDKGMRKVHSSRNAQDESMRAAVNQLHHMGLSRQVALERQKKQIANRASGSLPTTADSSSDSDNSSEESLAAKKKTRPEQPKRPPPPPGAASASAKFSSLPNPLSTSVSAAAVSAPPKPPRGKAEEKSPSALKPPQMTRATSSQTAASGGEEDEEEEVTMTQVFSIDDEEADEEGGENHESLLSRIQENPRVQGNGSLGVPLGQIFNVERFDGTPILRSPCEMIVIHCQDFREVKVFFQNKAHVFDVWKRLRHHVKAGSMSQTLHFVQKQLKVVEQPAGAMSSRELEGWNTYDVEKEFKRQQVSSKWQLSKLNGRYELCDSYPSLLYFPASVSDAIIAGSADFRSRHRLPTLSWYNARHGNCIARCAQPNTGLGNVSDFDELLVSAIRETTPKSNVMWIVDCRSKLAASGNRMKGHGTEQIGNGRYQRCRKLHMDIANIHAMRKSLDMIKDMTRDKTQAMGEKGYFKDLDATGWAYHCSALLAGAAKIAYYMEVKKISVLVHCSDGWDRTPQITSLAEVLCDPYYRTFDGFRVLVEKEWLSFGHKFQDRFGNTPDKPKERSPVFVQFLDCVHQIIHQFPTHFEFNSDYLVMLATHANSGWFGTFLYNTEQERQKYSISRSTLSIWNALDRKRAVLSQKNYIPSDKVLIPLSSVKEMSLWQGLYLRYDEVYFHIQSGEHTMEDKRTRDGGADDVVPTSKEGSLWKLGGRVKNWKLRYFYLANRQLRYFKDEKKKQERGKMDILDASIYSLSEDAVVSARCGFMLGVKPVRGSRIFLLQCTDKQDKVLWMQSLEDHGARHRGTVAQLDVSMMEPEEPPSRLPASFQTSKRNLKLDESKEQGVVLWTPDEWSDQCHECTSKFSVVRRRHHCRSCGRVFCAKCRSQKIVVPRLNLKKPSKVCNTCFDQLDTEQADDQQH